MSGNPIYLDYNATTPVDPSVLEQMLPYFTENFGNASSEHPYGWIAQKAVLDSLERIAGFIGANSQEIILTSGATESDNLAIKGVYERFSAYGNHIITVKTEHKAVLDSCRHLESLGAQVTYLDVDQDGLLDLNELESVITPKTILIAVMIGNNETGTIQPFEKIAEIAHLHNILFFADATQAVGKIPFSVKSIAADLIAFSSHKIYGPKGIGALYVNRKSTASRLISQMDGGGHQRGFRSGTLNTPSIVGFACACDLINTYRVEDSMKLASFRDRIEKSLLSLQGVHVNGGQARRLPHVSSLSIEGVDGGQLLSACIKTLALSSTSACNAALASPSHVLKAMGLSDKLAYSTLRLSMGHYLKSSEVDFAIGEITRIIKLLRK